MKRDCRVYFRKHKCKICVFGIVLLCCYAIHTKNARAIRLSSHRNVTICHPKHHQVTDNSLENNIKFIEKYEFPSTAWSKYKEHFTLEKGAEPDEFGDIPVIGTAASANHFTESLLMLKNLQNTLLKRYKNLKVYYYDIGLSKWQKERVREYPMVSVRRFPFSDFPGHVSTLKGYAWKPLIIQMLLEEFGFVMWMDTSIRFTSSDQDRLFKAAQEHGLIYRPGFYNVVIHTDLDTFYFLKEEPCEFSRQNEIEANFLLIYKTQFIHDFFMKPAVLCALSFGCMVTKTSHRKIDCSNKIFPHACHRFDQSVFSILLSRLYSSGRTNQVTEYSDIQLCRGLEVPILGETFNSILIYFIYWLTSSSDVCFR